MSYNDIYYEGRGNCPVCGRFCGHILGTVSEEIGIIKVDGVCKVHGLVDLTNQAWNYDDFVRGDEEEEQSAEVR